MPNRRLFSENLKYFLLYLLLTCLYFNKIFIEGVVILTGDALLQNYPLREFYANSIKSFTLPLWNPYEFAGLPFLGQMQTGALYPINLILYFLLPAPYAFNTSFILHYALAGFFTFLYLRAVGIEKFSAFAGGAVFALSGFLVSHKPHTAIVNASVWLPLILLFLERLRQTFEFRYAALTALAIGVQLLAGNFQMCVYTYIVVFLFFSYYTFTVAGASRARFLGYGALAMALGLVVASPQIFSVVEMAGLSYRSAFSRIVGYDYMALYHVYISTLPSLFLPYLFGGGKYGALGSAAFPDMMSPFAGAAATVLAVLCLFIERRNPHVRFWGAAAVIGLVLSLGSSTPLFRALHHVPVFRDMRAHGRNLLEFSLAVSALMAFALDRIFRGGDAARSLLKAATLALGSVIVLILGTVVYLKYTDYGDLAERLRAIGYADPLALLQSITPGNPAVFIPLAFLSAYLAWCVLYPRANSAALKYALVALMVAEGFSFGAFHEMDGTPIGGMGRTYGMGGAYAFVKAKGPDRVMKISTSFAGASLYNVAREVGAVNSYDQLSVEDYIRLLELNSEGLMPRDAEQMDLLLRNNIILSALNTKYIFLPRDVWFDAMGALAADSKPEAREIAAQWYSDGGVVREDGAFVFAPGDAQRPPELHAKVSLERGAHYMAFTAQKAGPKKSALVLRVYFPPDYKSSHRVEVLLDSHPHPEKTVFYAPTDGDYVISLSANSSELTKVRDLKLVSVTPYVPPLMNDAGSEWRQLYPPVYDAGDVIVYENMNALPRAYMVEEAVPVADFAELNEKLYTFRANPGSQALIYASDARALGGLSFTRGKAEIKEYGLHHVKIEVDTAGRGFLVFSDQFYPGWKAYVDGAETRICETNGVMRGASVPAGKHTVEFRYRPRMLFFLLGLGLLVAAWLIYCAATRKRQ